MDGFIAILIILVLIIGPRLVLKGIKGTVKAGVRTAKGEGSISENIGLEFKGMGPFEIRALIDTVGDPGEEFEVLVIEGKGLLPIDEPTPMTASLSLFAKNSGGRWAPVLSSLDNYQELQTIVFNAKSDHGEVPANVGFPTWSRLGVAAIIPTLTPPFSGRQEVLCAFRWLDESRDSEIRYGLPVDRRAILGSYEQSLLVDLSEVKGYEEAEENIIKIKGWAVQLGVAVAMSDSNFDEAEGQLIKHWIQKQLTRFDGQKLAVNQINGIADKAEKFEVIELCMDVMAADGSAHESEMKLIWSISDALGVDRKEVELLKDKKVLNLDVQAGVEKQSAESILGIDPSWPISRKKQVLREEFAKWNARIEGLKDASEKAKAQQMLDLIAEARNQL